MPPGNAPPPVPAGAFSLNSPSILQSCGRSSWRHFESSRPVSCPLGTSPRLKRQFWLNETLFPGREFAKQRGTKNRSKQKETATFNVLFIGFDLFGFIDRIYKIKQDFKMNPVNSEKSCK